MTMRPLALLVVALLLPALAQPAGAQARPPAAPTVGGIPVQMGIAIRPETLTVGDPFTVTVRVRAPQGATIRFPEKPDTLSDAELLDPVRVTATADSAERTAVYRMAAWDVGEVPIVLGAVLVRASGEERAVDLGNLRVFVESVLPADSAQRVPKPPRPPFDIERSLWWLWALLALAALLVGWLLWRWLQRRRATAPMEAIDPFTFAEREFERVEALGLVEAGERGRYVALVVEVLREYLARRSPDAAASLTSTELLHALRRDGRVPSARLAPILAEADLVKFARRPVNADRAKAIGAEARAIVRDVQRAFAASEASESTAADAPVRRRDAA
jgi:hypothetical protein